MPLLAPGTTRAPGPRLRERSCRVAVKEVDVIHSCPATVAASGAGVKSNRLASGRPPSRPTDPSVNVDLRMPAAGVPAHPLEGMTNEREARFLGRTSLKAGLIALPSGIIVGSGTPGPEDEWKMPLRRLMRLSLRRSDPLSRPGSAFGCPQAGESNDPESLLGVVSRSEVGAPSGTRTHDLQVRNLTLYPLSYGRALDFAEDWRRGRDLNPRRL